MFEYISKKTVKVNQSISEVVTKIEAAVEQIKAGGVVIVTDDDNRENEGDFIAAAELATPEMVNFMVKEGRGLLCVGLRKDRCDELELNMMVNDNTSTNETQFTVTVDLLGDHVTTGISASDRAFTIQALVDSKTKPEELGRPGHIFPLVAHEGGLLERPGHTEAAVLLPELAGLKSGGALIEVMKDDGTMARYDDLVEVSETHNIPLITIEELIAYLNHKK